MQLSDQRRNRLRATPDGFLPAQIVSNLRAELARGINFPNRRIKQGSSATSFNPRSLPRGRVHGPRSQSRDARKRPWIISEGRVQPTASAKRGLGERQGTKRGSAKS